MIHFRWAKAKSPTSLVSACRAERRRVADKAANNLFRVSSKLSSKILEVYLGTHVELKGLFQSLIKGARGF